MAKREVNTQFFGRYKFVLMNAIRVFQITKKLILLGTCKDPTRSSRRPDRTIKLEWPHESFSASINLKLAKSVTLLRVLWSAVVCSKLCDCDV